MKPTSKLEMHNECKNPVVSVFCAPASSAAALIAPTTTTTTKQNEPLEYKLESTVDSEACLLTRNMHVECVQANSSEPQADTNHSHTNTDADTEMKTDSSSWDSAGLLQEHHQHHHHHHHNHQHHHHHNHQHHHQHHHHRQHALGQSLDTTNISPQTRYHLRMDVRPTIFGSFYLGEDRITGQPVAIKVSVRSLMENHTSRRGGLVNEDPVKECAIMRHIGSHPHIVQLVAEHVDPLLHWMVMEYVAGGDLFELLVHHKRFSEEVARHFFMCLLSGLSHMHRQGVCHLDLSLENLLADEKGFAKIGDFGVARMVQPGELLQASATYKPGKLSYMDPQIYAQGLFDGMKADMFSCGVILFTLLTGTLPFELPTLQNKRYALIASGHLPELLTLLDMTNLVSEGAIDLIGKLLSFDPRCRPTLGEVAVHPWIAPYLAQPSSNTTNNNNNNNNHNHNQTQT